VRERKRGGKEREREREGKRNLEKWQKFKKRNIPPKILHILKAL
jgi:hypothetical protein